MQMKNMMEEPGGRFPKASLQTSDSPVDHTDLSGTLKGHCVSIWSGTGQ